MKSETFLGRDNDLGDAPAEQEFLVGFFLGLFPVGLNLLFYNLSQLEFLPDELPNRCLCSEFSRSLSNEALDDGSGVVGDFPFDYIGFGAGLRGCFGKVRDRGLFRFIQADDRKIGNVAGVKMWDTCPVSGAEQERAAVCAVRQRSE